MSSLSVTLRTALACALAAAVIPANAAEADSGRGSRPIPSWYIGMNGSMNFVKNSSMIQRDVATPVNAAIEFDDGYGLSGALGYRPRYTGTFLDNTRMEIEIGMLDNDIEKFVVAGAGGTTSDGEVQARKLMANLYLDMDVTQQIRPYIGGGVGLARLFLDDGTTEEEDTVLAYQGMTGITYIPKSFPLAEIGVGYRYLGTAESEFNSPANNAAVEMEYDAHNLEAALRLYF